MFDVCFSVSPWAVGCVGIGVSCVATALWGTFAIDFIAHFTALLTRRDADATPTQPNIQALYIGGRDASVYIL